MYNDNLLVGINFDWNLFGQENAPLELIIEITSELQKRKKELTFNKFEGVRALEMQSRIILEKE